MVYSGWKDELINPQPQYANMASLKYSIDEVFTYFQEGNGQTVEKFWEKIKEAGLPYKRENKLVKILKRKRIKDDIEYDFVIDVIVPYQEEGLISADEVALLNQWIGDFEKKIKVSLSRCRSSLREKAFLCHYGIFLPTMYISQTPSQLC